MDILLLFRPQFQRPNGQAVHDQGRVRSLVLAAAFSPVAERRTLLQLHNSQCAAVVQDTERYSLGCGACGVRGASHWVPLRREECGETDVGLSILGLAADSHP